MHNADQVALGVLGDCECGEVFNCIIYTLKRLNELVNENLLIVYL